MIESCFLKHALKMITSFFYQIIKSLYSYWFPLQVSRGTFFRTLFLKRKPPSWRWIGLLLIIRHKNHHNYTFRIIFLNFFFMNLFRLKLLSRSVHQFLFNIKTNQNIITKTNPTDRIKNSNKKIFFKSPVYLGWSSAHEWASIDRAVVHSPQVGGRAPGLIPTSSLDR